MKCLILAAGYATRLYPLTENFPKPLLDVAGKPILDWLVDDLEKDGRIEEYYVVTNHKFAPIFEKWAVSHRAVTIIDDGTASNETRLGAVKDMQLAIDLIDRRSRPGRESGLLVMAGDNLLDFSLSEFVRFAEEKKASCVMRYFEPDETRLRRSGVAELGPGDRLLSMAEKPEQPASHWCVPAFYCFAPGDLRLVHRAVEEGGCGTDAPGSFIAWLCGRAAVYAWEMPGHRFDIGTLEGYKEICSRFRSL